MRLLIFLLAILIPPCASSSPAFLMMYSALTMAIQAIGPGISQVLFSPSHLLEVRSQDFRNHAPEPTVGAKVAALILS